VVPGPPFKIGAPPFHVWPPVATHIQCCILKCGPPFWFLAPLLLNPGDGPGSIPSVVIISLHVRKHAIIFNLA